MSPRRESSFRGLREQPATDDRRETECEEPEVPGPLVDPGALAEVVKPENTMVHDTLDDVQEAPTNEKPADEGPAAGRPAPVVGATPEEVDSCRDRQPRAGMEQPVGKRVVLEAADRRLLEASLTGQHVVPLKDLMEHDPVDETAEADPETDPGETWTRNRVPFRLASLAAGERPRAFCRGHPARSSRASGSWATAGPNSSRRGSLRKGRPERAR